MAQLFSQDYFLLWAAVLAIALFLPVRQLIWVLYVRRAMAKAGEIDQAEQERLKRRAGVTSALICVVFSVLYTANLFKGG